MGVCDVDQALDLLARIVGDRRAVRARQPPRGSLEFRSRTRGRGDVAAAGPFHVALGPVEVLELVPDGVGRLREATGASRAPCRSSAPTCHRAVWRRRGQARAGDVAQESGPSSDAPVGRAWLVVRPARRWGRWPPTLAELHDQAARRRAPRPRWRGVLPRPSRRRAESRWRPRPHRPAPQARHGCASLAELQRQRDLFESPLGDLRWVLAYLDEMVMAREPEAVVQRLRRLAHRVTGLGRGAARGPRRMDAPETPPRAAPPQQAGPRAAPEQVDEPAVEAAERAGGRSTPPGGLRPRTCDELSDGRTA